MPFTVMQHRFPIYFQSADGTYQFRTDTRRFITSGDSDDGKQSTFSTTKSDVSCIGGMTVLLRLQQLTELRLYSYINGLRASFQQMYLRI
jgi:hypothetical protein